MVGKKYKGKRIFLPLTSCHNLLFCCKILVSYRIDSLENSKSCFKLFNLVSYRIDSLEIIPNKIG